MGNYRVLILMSTYNGNTKIERQIESIIKQKDVDIMINIRDDGSSIETRDELERLNFMYPDKITIQIGENIGWKRSFRELIYSAPKNFDYYAFSDQDDIWMDDKLISCIKLIEQDSDSGVKLAHCNALSVDENLNPRKEQEYRTPYPPNYKATIATEYFQGCGMVWNKKAMHLVQSYKPQNNDLAHDYWVGLICYLFGKIFFCTEPKFYHIRYGNNQSSDGSIMKGRATRAIKMLHGESAYMNPAEDMLRGYADLLPENEKDFLKSVLNYKNKGKFKLLFDKDFKRPTTSSTLLFKIQILLSRY